MIQYKFVVKLLATFAVFSMLSVITGNAAIGDLNAASKTISGHARSVAAPSVQWEQTFGGSVGNSTGRRVQQTTDGGYIIVGTTTSFGANNSRYYLVKTDSSGKQQWEQTFGGSVGNGTGRGVQQTTDGGYIIVGQTDSFSSGKLKVYLVKTDSSGSMQWQQTYGGNKYNFGATVQQTTDGGYVFFGTTVADNHYLAYLVKTDSSGTMQWEQTFPGPYDQNGGTSVRQTTDGGYIITGTAIQSRDQSYAYVAKTDSSGKVQWEQTFGGKGLTTGMSVQQTKDSGYVIGGATNSSGAGKQEFYLIKTDSSGTKQWQQTFGGNGDSIAYAVQQTNDGGYIIGGTDSLTAANRTQALLVKTDSSGNMQWQETLSGNGDCAAYDVQQTNDSGYIVVGSTYPGHASLVDVYLAKL
jgi:hypothetical protein